MSAKAVNYLRLIRTKNPVLGILRLGWVASATSFLTNPVRCSRSVFCFIGALSYETKKRPTELVAAAERLYQIVKKNICLTGRLQRVYCR